ncbi:MAG: long-chain acyl-CoA synthetase [Motiliproteus sp.]|jgi:long-chain acyl-CoA synthetase
MLNSSQKTAPLPQPCMILQRIAQHARQTPDAPALQGSRETLSYAQLQARIQALSLRLQASGFSQLGLLMDNGPDWIICQLAAMAADLCVVPVPLFFSAAQTRHLLDSCDLELLLCDQPSRLEALGIEASPLADLYSGAFRRRESGRLSPPLSRPHGTRLITFTSGSTGQPKGVCLSTASLDLLCHSLYLQIEPLQIERHTSLLPLSVLLEHVAGVLLSLYAGAQCSIYGSERTGLTGSGQLDPSAFTALLQHSQPQSLILVPELLQALVGLAAQGQIPESLRFVAVGGGPVAPQILRQAQQLGLPVYEGYGLSECGSVVSLNTPQQQRAGSVGRPLSHCEVKLSEQQEILVRGAAMLGYLGDSEPSAVSRHTPQKSGRGAAMLDSSGKLGKSLSTTEPPVESPAEWLATGDIGHLDDAGFLSIQGRKGNVLINSFGRNLSPEWIEAELCASPAIDQACLFGDARPFNIALLTPATDATPKAIDDWIEQLNGRLPDYARVSDWISSRAPFSAANSLLTSNGRLRRDAIHNAYQQAVEQRYQRRLAAPTSPAQPHFQPDTQPQRQPSPQLGGNQEPL